ncbi:putative Ig domain-containing protein [Singulisphaera sp. Ch08]|uniref:Ig domain-containing protein n=1 Tax=Singulisphaera sp. Ch08 TaxID=3120278 RepID=A0AAU7C909_9BACT
MTSENQRREREGAARHQPRPRDHSGRLRRVLLGLEALETRAVPATITVTTNADDPGLALDSLRAAIASINAGADANAAVTTARTGAGYGTDDTIAFKIAGAGVQTIALGSPLPPLLVPMMIDGYSQPGAQANTQSGGSNAHLLIELDGRDAGFLVDILTIATSDSVIRGLVISRIGGTGVAIKGTSSTNNVVAGNFIGTDATGTAGNLLLGNIIGVGIKEGATGNTVGGTTLAARNLISGNSYVGVQIQGTGTSGNVVAGNFIGTNAAGSLPIMNGTGVSVSGGATGNIIGGTMAGAGNLISGNNNFNVQITDAGTSDNVVAGNSIGLDSAGTDSFPYQVGVLINNGATGNKVGGTTADASNLISGNRYGVLIQNPGTTGNLVVGNIIGAADAVGSGHFKNVYGVAILDEATGNTIGGTMPGAGNTIAFNAKGVIVGLYSTDGTTVDNSILGNRIFGNTTIGIDLGNDGPTPNGFHPWPFPNHGQNAPSLFVAPGTTVVSGVLDSDGNSTYRIELFASPVGSVVQGANFLGSVVVTTDPSGHARFDFGQLALPAGMAFTATATLESSGGFGDTSELSTPLYLPVNISPDSLPVMTAQSPFHATVTATGGRGGYGFALAFGTLPTGLAFNPITGQLAGTPTITGESFDFTIIATDSGGSQDAHQYQGVVHAAIALSPATLPSLTVGSPFRLIETAVGGSGGPYRFTVTAGALPAGLTLDPSTGLFSGAPTAAGEYAFTVTATAGAGDIGRHAFSGVVDPASIPSPTPTPTPAVGPAPVIQDLQRFGIMAQPTTLVLTFSTALDLARAQDVGNYTLFSVEAKGRRLRPVRLAAATYDPVHFTVTLVPVARSLKLRQTYLLRINGSAPSGLASPSGAQLDGLGNGQRGSSYSRAFGAGVLSGPNRLLHQAPSAHATLPSGSHFARVMERTSAMSKASPNPFLPTSTRSALASSPG